MRKVPLKPLVPSVRRLLAPVRRLARWDRCTHTDTEDKYRNPRGACAPRVNYAQDRRLRKLRWPTGFTRRARTHCDTHCGTPCSIHPPLQRSAEVFGPRLKLMNPHGAHADGSTHVRQELLHVGSWSPVDIADTTRVLAFCSWRFSDG